MRVLDGDQFLVRIFLDESDKWHHTPLPRAFVGATAPRRFCRCNRDSRCRGFWRKQCDSHRQPPATIDRPAGVD